MARIVDFTFPFYKDKGTVVWPGPPPGMPTPKLEEIATHEKNGWLSHALKNFITHTGTHMEAPAHILKKGKMLHELPLERFIGDGVVLDIPKGENEYITPADLDKARPQVRKGDIVIIHTHWDAKWWTESPEYLVNKRPGLSVEAAEWLAKKEINALGTDTFAPQIGGVLDTKEPSVHHTLMKKDIIMVEQLTNLCEIAGKRAKIIMLPLNLIGVESSPARVVAIIG